MLIPAMSQTISDAETISEAESAHAITIPMASMAVINWLYLCAFMVFAMAVIGAITRLTESGLSIVEWKPLIGAIPPLNDTEWQRVFELYQQSPEYRLKNAGMSMAEFQNIFFWEWLHRLWGRLIGVVYALPFFWFLLRRKLPRECTGRFWLLLALGGLQGVVGWFMVMSGLVDRPSVSHYRLALHLGMATLIFVLLLLTAWQLRYPAKRMAEMESVPGSLALHGWLSLWMVALTMVWGAFVAGLDAGMFYNSFPLMDGTWLPSEFFDTKPFMLGLVENPALVQFVHRYLALTTAALLIALALRCVAGSRWPVQVRALGLVTGTAACLQAGLGIATLLTQVWIPLAALHQAGALILLALTTATVMLIGRHQSRTAISA
jgi:heme a synthase